MYFEETLSDFIRRHEAVRENCDIIAAFRELGTFLDKKGSRDIHELDAVLDRIALTCAFSVFFRAGQGAYDVLGQMMSAGIKIMEIEHPSLDVSRIQDDIIFRMGQKYHLFRDRRLHMEMTGGVVTCRFPAMISDTPHRGRIIYPIMNVTQYAYALVESCLNDCLGAPETDESRNIQRQIYGELASKDMNEIRYLCIAEYLARYIDVFAVRGIELSHVEKMVPDIRLRNIAGRV